MSAVWTLRDVHKSYSVARSRVGWVRQPLHVLKGVNLEIQAGERVGIVGASGSGKTTLAGVGLGLTPADRGQIHLFGEDTSSWRATDWRRMRRRVQILFQDARAMLNPFVPLALLLEESAALHRPEVDPRQAALSVLEAVGLEGRENALPGQLSGGERRRAGIARLLLTRPDLVVADELTTGLDAARKADLVTFLFEQLGPDCAIVLISHDLPLVLWACHRVIVMYEGQVVDHFSSQDWRTHSGHSHTRALFEAAGIHGETP